MSFFKVLGVLATFLTVAILWQNFMFSRFDKRLDDKIKPIETALNNHLSDTNKKIEKLDQKIDTLDKKIDDRFDKLNGRFDNLYNILLKDKQSSK